MRNCAGMFTLVCVYPKPHLSQGDAGRRVPPYLLRGAAIDRLNQVCIIYM